MSLHDKFDKAVCQQVGGHALEALRAVAGRER